jgi:hypothetical protein
MSRIGWAEYIWYAISPKYRIEVKREAGWALCVNACHYLLMKPSFDRADLDSAKILNNHAKSLNLA